MTGNTGTNLLARVLREELGRLAARDDPAELGTIEADGSLRLRRFSVPIPAGQYLRAAGLTLQPGDLVAVVWIGGRDPLVLCKVVTA